MLEDKGKGYQMIRQMIPEDEGRNLFDNYNIITDYLE